MTREVSPSAVGHPLVPPVFMCLPVDHEGAIAGYVPTFCFFSDFQRIFDFP
jgi:hypothetical protein